MLPGPPKRTGLPPRLQIRFPPFVGGRDGRRSLVEARPGRGEPGVQRRALALLVLARQLDLRAPRPGPAIRHESGFLNVGEERLHCVEVLGQERIELVIVTLGAAHGAAEPHRAQGPHAIGTVFREVFLRLQPAFRRGAVQAVVGGRHALVERCVRQQIAGDLFTREFVERLVAGERAQDVIAVRPRRNRIVAVETARVRIAHGVEPMHRSLLRVARRRQQPIDRFLIRVGRAVREEGAHVVRRRRHARQIERDAAQQRSGIRLVRRRHPVEAQAMLNEVVDRIFRRRRIGIVRHARTRDRLIRPMPFVDGAFGHPAPKCLLLLTRQLLVRRCGRHCPRPARRDARDDLAVVRIAGHNWRAARPGRLQRFVADIQAQAGHARVPVGTMAAKTGVRHDRPHVTVETDSLA